MTVTTTGERGGSSGSQSDNDHIGDGYSTHDGSSRSCVDRSGSDCGGGGLVRWTSEFLVGWVWSVVTIDTYDGSVHF